ncbi:MAG: hypothetical protein GY925_16665, partial [Actinomycetia bacterium]|nr:hypothetical protein [Actinomycetes bacterium]
ADKATVFSSAEWTAISGMPPDVGISFHVVGVDGENVEVRLAWGVESVTGETAFVVRSQDLIER